MDGALMASEMFPVENAATGLDRYLMSPESVLAAHRAAESRNLDVLATYHSHPNGTAVPSETDRQEAMPGMLHLILSGVPADARAWVRSKTGGMSSIPVKAPAP
jgi:proteasome lid subunit RPN8/RPN11